MKLFRRVTEGPGPLWWKIKRQLAAHDDQDRERARIKRQGIGGPLMDPDYVGPVLPEHIELFKMKQRPTDDH